MVSLNMVMINFPSWEKHTNAVLVWLLYILTTIYAIPSPSSTAILLNANPVDVKRLSYHRFHILKKRKSSIYDLSPSRSDDDYYYYESSRPTFPDNDAFQFQAEDAVSDIKFSPPVIENNPTGSPYFPHQSNFMPTSFSSVTHFQRPTIQISTHSKKSHNPLVTKVYTQSSSQPGWDSVIGEITVTSDYKVGAKIPTLVNDAPVEDPPHLLRNNFTEINDSQLLESSSDILKSHPHFGNDNHYKHQSTLIPQITKLPNNSTVIMPSLESETLLKDVKDISININKQSSNISAQMTFTETTVDPFKNTNWTTTPNYFDEKENISSILPPVGSNRHDLSSGALAGMVIAILCGVTVLSSSVIYLLYRKFNGKCTSVVDSKFNSDNCGYLDDSLRSSIYLNNHIELPKENSEEMTSLDNDSFLNSLETMTIQNYWTDNTKNTKV